MRPSGLVQVQVIHTDHDERTATEIVERIARGEWTATVVLEAFVQRAIVANAAVNAITEGKSALWPRDACCTMY